MDLSRFRILDGFTLKRIAICSMAIDHFGSIVMDGVLAPYMTDGAIMFTADMPFLIRYAPLIKAVCEALGSVAFPLFCFLLVEGFLHTHDRLRYVLRMAAFAVLSEVPFDLAHFGKPICFELQNVLFTLLIGICMLWAFAEIARNRYMFTSSRTWRSLFVLTAAAAMALAFLIRCEYVFLGVLTIALLYALRKNRYLQLLGFAPLLIVSPWILLAVPLVLLYDGLRGRGMQYFFYIFYPAHFLLFSGVAYLLAQR